MAIRTIYHFTAFTGGGATALDSVDGNRLLDNDRAFLIVSGVFYVYYLNATSGATPNGTTIIIPATNPGAKRWIRCT